MKERQRRNEEVDSNLTCEASKQTPNDNKQPGNRKGSGAAEKDIEEMKSKTAELEKFLEERMDISGT